MKTILIIFSLLIFWTAQAQRTVIVLNAGTNQVAATATNTVNSTAIYVPGEFVGVELAGVMTGAGAYTNTSADTITLETSATGTNWTANAFRLALTINGTNAATSSATSTSTLGGIPFIRVGAWEHPGPNIGTNLLIAVYLKPK